MTKILVSIHNGLLAEAMTAMLKESGDFLPLRLHPQSTPEELIRECTAPEVQMALLEVSYAGGTTLETRLREVRQLRRIRPDCKIVLLCDENSSPAIAREVMLAKKDGLIDNFLYSSLTAKYILASLSAM